MWAFVVCVLSLAASLALTARTWELRDELAALRKDHINPQDFAEGNNSLVVAEFVGLGIVTVLCASAGVWLLFALFACAAMVLLWRYLARNKNVYDEVVLNQPQVLAAHTKFASRLLVFYAVLSVVASGSLFVAVMEALQLHMMSIVHGVRLLLGL